jgi:hypothetical protein
MRARRIGRVVIPLQSMQTVIDAFLIKFFKDTFFCGGW